MKEIGERIKSQRKKLGLTGTNIKELTSISTGTLSDIEQGNSLPTTKSLMKLSKALNCSADWILFGESESFPIISDNRENLLLENFRVLPDDEKEELLEILYLKIQKEKKRNNLIQGSDHNISSFSDNLPTYNINQHIPILGYVAAGEPILSYENEINTIVPENAKVSYALIAKGNSMEPIIMNGEIIEVISQCELENGEIGIIKLNGAATCKCFYSTGKQYELRSLNPDIAPIIVSKESQPEMQIVGKVALTSIQQKRYNAL